MTVDDELSALKHDLRGHIRRLKLIVEYIDLRVKEGKKVESYISEDMDDAIEKTRVKWLELKEVVPIIEKAEK